MATPSNLFVNWTGVVITPSGGSAINVGEVTDIEIDSKSTQLPFYGDNRNFPRLVRNVAKSRTLKIMGGNPAILMTVPENTPCTIVAILNDAVNGVTATGGALTFTFTGCVRSDLPVKGANNQYASGTLSFSMQSDPSTDADPVSYVVL